MGKLKNYAVLPLVPVVFVAFYGGGLARALYGAARAVARGETGKDKIFSESERKGKR